MNTITTFPMIRETTTVNPLILLYSNIMMAYSGGTVSKQIGLCNTMYSKHHGACFHEMNKEMTAKDQSKDR